MSLPDVRPGSLMLPSPVEATTLLIEGYNVYAKLAPNDNSDLCE